MRWWDYTALFAAVFASVGMAGLMGAWAAERRLDRLQAKELYHPPVEPVNPQKLEDQGEARNG